VAALVIGIAYGRWPARTASALAFALLSPHLFVGLTRLDVSAVGHCSAILVSLLMGYVLRRSWRARPEWSATSR
jgi:membrane associated rhomboid family serine protease